MKDWSPQDWVLFLTALGTFVGVVLSAVAAFKANLAKISATEAKRAGDKNSEKIDHNTRLTEAGTAAAAKNAKVAAETAAEAKEAAVQVAENLNGKMEDKMRAIVREHVDPLSAMFRAHAEQDDKNMREIRGALGELRDRVK